MVNVPNGVFTLYFVSLDASLHIMKIIVRESGQKSAK